MALVKVDFFSQSLMRTVSVQAIIPVDKMVIAGQVPMIQQPFKTLYLLHGIFGNDSDWILGTRIQRWAQDYNLAVIMPSGENKFYVDNPQSHEYYSRFIGEELIQIMRNMFPLSNKREDTFIAGLSMGGYGAIVNGLKYHQTFGYIAGLSSAFILESAIQSTDGEDIPYLNKRSYLTSVFGDLDKVKGSHMDYYALVDSLIEDKAIFPNIYMACGTEDFLLQENRRFYQYLLENQVAVTYQEGPGGHEWDFWDCYLYKILEWLPLHEKAEAISSGHVQ